MNLLRVRGAEEEDKEPVDLAELVKGRMDASLGLGVVDRALQDAPYVTSDGHPSTARLNERLAKLG